MIPGFSDADPPSSALADAAIARVHDRLEMELSERQLSFGAPIFVQILKQENELRLFIQLDSADYDLFRTYPICAWSGDLGPKLKEGDGQSPEGFYTVGPGQMNPNSSYHLSFNLGFPNAYDRVNGRTGSFLMVHGKCASIGCYAMTDPVIEEIWALMSGAFDGGQLSVPVHIFPFAMTEENLSQYQDEQWVEFWKGLKPAWDAFELTKSPPGIKVRGRAYSVTVVSASGPDE